MVEPQVPLLAKFATVVGTQIIISGRTCFLAGFGVVTEVETIVAGLNVNVFPRYYSLMIENNVPVDEFIENLMIRTSVHDLSDFFILFALIGYLANLLYGSRVKVVI